MNTYMSHTLRPSLRLLALLLSLPLLRAQTIDTVGGTTAPTSGANRGKGSLYRVDTTVLLTEFEVWLDVPATETLTFFVYRHHSRAGTATLDWTLAVPVNGTGVGPAWYSTGPIRLPLIDGNHYVLGVSWPGTVTYFFSVAGTGAPVSFGSWQRAHTLANPLPSTLSIPAGVDSAQYRQRITSIALPAVIDVGTGCSATALAPRLVATGLFTIGSSEGLDLVDAAASALGVFAVGLAPTLAVPVPLFGCSLWLNPTAGLVTNSMFTSTAGVANLTLPVPNNPLLRGTQLSMQAGVLTAAVDLTNAIDVTVY